MPPKKRDRSSGTIKQAISDKKRRTEKKKQVAVTLLSGFLGSGKTSLLKNVLSSRDHNLRCAVIVNEISELNIDAFAMGGTTGVMQVSDKMVEMANGCICCTLREDLLNQLREIAESGKYDCVLIESSGIAEPMQVSETFFVELDDGKGPLQKQARLDNCVTVVDSSMIRSYLHTDDDMKVVDPRAEGEEAEQHISSLLLDQLEFANVILLNKVDRVLPNASKEEQEAEIASLTQVVRSINPNAKIIPTTHCAVEVKEILDTNNFTEEFALGKNNWMEDIKTGVKHVPETLEYGVSSMMFRDERAFHPQRLHDWLIKYFILEEIHPTPTMMEDEEEEQEQQQGEGQGEKKPHVHGPGCSHQPAAVNAEKLAPEELKARAATRRAARIERYGDLYRTKGFVFLGNPRRLSFFGAVSHSGNTFTFGMGGQWQEFPVASSTETCEQDPGQQLVFIGQNLKHDQLRADLEALLLNPEEEKILEKAVRKDPFGEDCFPDPLAAFFNEEDLEEVEETDSEEEEEDEEDDA